MLLLIMNVSLLLFYYLQVFRQNRYLNKSGMTTEQTPSAYEDHIISVKPTEKQIRVLVNMFFANYCVQVQEL